jgi:hypothetical protein
MGSAAGTGLTAERVAILRRQLAEKFEGRPAIRRAILSVLEPLEQGWANSGQGMTGESLDKINAALLDPLEALLSVPADKAEYSADQLAQAWEKIRGDIDWND